MLSHQVMGLLALGILWVNTLLIAAAAAKQAAALLRRLRGLRPLAPGQPGTGLLRGTVAQGAGADGALARFAVEQVGRAAELQGAARTIHFADRTFVGAVLGGTLSVAGTLVRVPAGDGEVWPDRAGVDAAAACPDAAGFAAVYSDARKARGYGRTVSVALPAGQTIWVAGQVRRGPAGLELTPEHGAGGGILVSALDPRRWIYGRAALAIGFLVAAVLVAAVVTAGALVPPRFGQVSTLFGLAGLGFFLGVQPLGTAVRDALLPPSRACVRGRWVEPLSPDRASPQLG